jgi:hypothetical protein
MNPILSSINLPSPSMMKQFKQLSYITTMADIVINIYYNHSTNQILAMMNNQAWFINPMATINATLAELIFVNRVQIKIDTIEVDTPDGSSYDVIADEWVIYDRSWAYYGDKKLIVNFKVSLREPESGSGAFATTTKQLATIFNRLSRKLTSPYLGAIIEDKIMEESKDKDKDKDADDSFDNIHDSRAELLRKWN